MLQIEREIVQRENTYATNEIENRRLEQVRTRSLAARPTPALFTASRIDQLLRLALRSCTPSYSHSICRRL